MLGMLGISFYILADTFFVSAGMGKTGVAALNLAMPVYNFIHGIGLLLAIGGATKATVFRSRNEKAEADAVFTNTCMLGAAFCLLFVSAGVFFSRPITRLFGAEGEAFEMAHTYLRVMLLFSPAFIFNDIVVCFVRNDGSPQLSMAAVLTGSLANVLLDYVFIFPCKMGMFGAILATGLSPCLGLCVCAAHFIGKKSGFSLVPTPPAWRYMKYCFMLGFPSLVEQLSSAAVIISFNYLVLGLKGNTGVAAYAVVANISLVVVALFTGLVQGVQPLWSRAHGEGNEADKRRLFSYAVTFSLIFSVIVYAAVFVFSRQIADIFNRENDALLRSIAVTGLKIYFIAAPFVGMNVLFCSYFSSTERALPSQILSLLRGVVFILPAAFAFSALWGIVGVWASFPAAEFCAFLVGVGMLVFLRRGAKRVGTPLGTEKTVGGKNDRASE